MHRTAVLTGWRASAALAAIAAWLWLASVAHAGWLPAQVISSELPEAPAIAVSAHGTAVLANADAGGVWVARLGRDGRPGRRIQVPGPEDCQGPHPSRSPTTAR